MDRSNLIKEYVDLKGKHQQLFYKYNKLKDRFGSLEKENVKLKSQIHSINSSEENKTILRENKRLQARVSDLKRISVSTPIIILSTPKSKKIKRKSERQEVFEVDQLISHQGRKGNREFLVRWKGFTDEHDTWEKEANLSCPNILKIYLKKHRLAV